MEQSVNPAVRVGHYTRTISTSTQNASIWSLTAAAPSDRVFRALCKICLLTYLLTYVLAYINEMIEVLANIGVKVKAVADDVKVCVRL